MAGSCGKWHYADERFYQALCQSLALKQGLLVEIFQCPMALWLHHRRDLSGWKKAEVSGNAASSNGVLKNEPAAIFHTTRGSQFNSEDFFDVLRNHGIRVSMNGKNRWADRLYPVSCR